MATVTNTITLPGGGTPTHCAVEIELIASETGSPAAGWITASDVTILARYRPTVTNGAWTASLTPNADIDPAGTVYKVTEYADKTRVVNYIEVGSGGGTVHDLLTSGPSGPVFDSVTNHNANGSAHTGFYRSGGTDVAVTDGGTGASTAAAARTSLSVQRQYKVDVRDFASPQAAIDSLSGARGIVEFPAGTYTFDASLDVKRAHLQGAGGPGNSGGGGTILSFSGTTGIYSSISDNYGYRLSWLEIRGSAGNAPSSDNGQVLVDMTGQNYPRITECRIRQAGTGLKLTDSASVESHYGRFTLDISDCYVGVSIAGSVGEANSHVFVGGRWSTCVTGVLIGSGQSNITFIGTAFECGSGNVAVDSTGLNCDFFGCRWETIGTNLLIREGAGNHYVWGGHVSSGLDIVDENVPSVVWGIAHTTQAPPHAAAATLNLISNGSFERDSNGDGLADGWTETYSSIGSGYVATLDSGNARYGSYSQKIVTGSRNNARIYQQFTCNPNVAHCLLLTYKVNAGTTQLRIGSAQGGTEYINTALTADDEWHELRLLFTPTVATPFLTVYAVGTTDRTIYLDGVSINEGISALPGFQQRAIPESGGMLLGALGVAKYTTAARPSASTAGQGAMIYDTTLGVPIWSNGTDWKNAAGTTV